MQIDILQLNSSYKCWESLKPVHLEGKIILFLLNLSEFTGLFYCTDLFVGLFLGLYAPEQNSTVRPCAMRTHIVSLTRASSKYITGLVGTVLWSRHVVTPWHPLVRRHIASTINSGTRPSVIHRLWGICAPGTKVK